MAKNQSSGEDRAKVKLRITDFELEGSNASVEASIRQIVQGLNARNAVVQTRQIPVKQPKELSGSASDVAEEEYLPEDESEVEDEDPPAAAAVAKRQKKPPVYPLPDYKHDLDLTVGTPSFKNFVASKKITKQTSRYLASAFWLKDHGNSPTIDIHKIYTCYKTAGWPMKIEDWDNNFRQLVRANTMRRVNPGEYAITPLGENAVRELDAAE